MSLCMVLHELAFQFTPLREGRHRKKMRKRALHDFNSRPSARGDGLQCGIILSGQTFQFTPLREGRRAQYWFPVPEVFQFTPLREGRRFGWMRNPSTGHFNSRPSARGDNPDTTTGRDNHISIHAPPRGATQSARRSCPACKHFNSRPSARGDGVSASTMARTAKFQFTPLREGRPGRVRRYDCGITFQFTPLREGRRRKRVG